MDFTKKKSFLLMIMLLFIYTMVAQQSISGNIKDEQGMPLGGVNVILDGTTIGAVSDFDGNYLINDIEDGTYKLSATYIGYKKITKSITVQGKDITVNIQMELDAQSLDEVVITGVVNPKSKLESSISVSTMSVKRIEEAAPRSAGELFRNIPGIRAESSGGEGNANFNVRGVPVSSGGSRYFKYKKMVCR